MYKIKVIQKGFPFSIGRRTCSQLKTNKTLVICRVVLHKNARRQIGYCKRNKSSNICTKCKKIVCGKCV